MVGVSASTGRAGIIIRLTDQHQSSAGRQGLNSEQSVPVLVFFTFNVIPC